MSNTIPGAPSRIKVRVVWRLVLSLLLHLTLLLFLAIFLEWSLDNVRSYVPAANAKEIEMESFNNIPQLLGAMDTVRHAYQKSNDPRDLAVYNQIRDTALGNLDSLNTPLLLPSAEETQRRTLARRWIAEVGDASVKQPRIQTAEAFDTQSRALLAELNQLTGKLRVDTETTLAGLQSQEASEAGGLVNLMWIGVGTVSLITLVFQYLVANSIIGPVQLLTRAVRRMEGGDFSARVYLRSGDEIESLGQTFNTMAGNIQRSQNELEDKNARLSAQGEALRDANAGLEERVALKTHELEDKNQKLSEAARLKDEFLATLSHELRTPLTPVVSCAHLLGTDPTLGADQLKNVAVIDRNARALSRMIDELLDLSAVMNRKLRLVRETIEMNEWTRATLETMRPVWEKKKLVLTFVPENQPVELEIDATRLAQVLTNLITNAVKYTPQRGKITVRLESLPDQVRIAVTDTGAGLNQQEIHQIFEMFHQSRTAQTQSVGGLGVGLTVARSLAELHGGGLLAESPGPDQGATFTLWLPRVVLSPGADASVPSPALSSMAIDRQVLRGKRILIVEDSPDTREALQRIFQRRECLVATAPSAEEALELALREPPEIVISDVGLPAMSGLELMTRLRARPEFRNVVAIALSGLGREDDVRAATEAGFDAHLLKPVDIAVLDATLVEQFGKRARSG